ncbi:MAG: glycosyltransferase family 2 protein [Plesiomonas sp.]|uniref:glycosyltransferase family 2 protein n=1 Tax=Plesiomonas sp. TaxID=2486279 RepID=UPI003F3F884B
MRNKEKKDCSIDKIAILITCFNSAEFITRSLDSINNMILKKDVNVYIYDDCSTDHTISIIESRKEQYNYNIYILSGKENVGPGIARNRLINAIRDEKYFIICDADDSFKSDLLEELNPIIDKNIYDIIEFKHYYHNLTNNYITIPRNFIEKHGEISSFEKEFFLKNNFYSWGKAYRSSFIKKNNICFSEYRLYEDTKFVFDAITKAEKYYSIDKYLFISHPESNSETRKITGDLHIKCFSQAMKDVDSIEFYNTYAKKIVFFELFNRCKRYSTKTSTDQYDAEKFLLDTWINLETVKKIPETEMALHNYNVEKISNKKNLYYFQNRANIYITQKQ